MKYVNGKDIFPPKLLKQIQSYSSGKLVYIPSEEKRGWGETTGYRRHLATRNRDIRQNFAHGATVSELADMFSLSVESIHRIKGGIHRGLRLHPHQRQTSLRPWRAGKVDPHLSAHRW